MPVAARKVGGKWRVVEVATGKIASNKGGTAADGGGHGSAAKARAQAAAINISLAGKRRKRR